MRVPCRKRHNDGVDRVSGKDRMPAFPDIPQEGTITWWVYQHQELVMLPCFERESRLTSVVDSMKECGTRPGARFR